MSELQGTGRHLAPDELRLWTSFLDAARIIETELADQLVDDHGMTHREYEVLVRVDGAGGAMRMATLSRQIEASRALTSAPRPCELPQNPTLNWFDVCSSTRWSPTTGRRSPRTSARSPTTSARTGAATVAVMKTVRWVSTLSGVSVGQGLVPGPQSGRRLTEMTLHKL